MRKPTTAAESQRKQFVIVTMDSHLSSATERAALRLAQEDPTLTVVIHAAEEWGNSPAALERCCADIAAGDIIVVMMLFMEDHFLPVLQALRDRREHCDAMICAMSAGEVVKLTRVGGFSMDGTQSGPMALLKRLRGAKKDKQTGGAAQMKMLRRIPQFLRFIPGSAQDVRAYFLTLQYWARRIGRKHFEHGALFDGTLCRASASGSDAVARRTAGRLSGSRRLPSSISGPLQRE